MPIQIRFNVLLRDKELKEGRRITYREIAQATGLPEASIATWDKGRITQYSKKVLEAFCIYFNCNTGDIIPFMPEEKEVATEQVTNVIK